MQSTRGNGERPTVVLVHGAWADALSWQGVIPLVQREGYHVTAVENPLTSFADDVATTRRMIDAQDAAGAFYIDLAKFNEVFAGDLPTEQASVMAAAQKPFAGSIFGASVVGAPAWKSIPTWYVVARNDRVIKPELQRFMAERMGARTSELDSSHVAYVSHPNEIARLIDEVASSVAGAVAAT